MSWFWKRSSSPDWFIRFIDDLRCLHADLAPAFAGPFECRAGSAEMWTEAPTPRHRAMYLGGSVEDFEYSLGKIWIEGLRLSPKSCQYLLARVDAVIAGGVKEVRDLETGVLWHVYRLKTRGLEGFVRDTQYSFWHSRWLRHRVRRVSVTRLDPMIFA